MSFDINKLRKLQKTSNAGMNTSVQDFIKNFENYLNSEEFENFLQTALTNKIVRGDTPKIYCGLPTNSDNHTVFVICESKLVDAKPINGKVFNFWTAVNGNSNDELKKSILNTINICYELLINKLESLGIQVISKNQTFSIIYTENDSHAINLLL